MAAVGRGRAGTRARVAGGGGSRAQMKIRSACKRRCGVAPRIVLRGRLQSGDAALKPVLAPPPPSPSPLAAALALTSPSLPLPHRSPSPPSRQFLIFRISRTTRRSLSSSTRARRSRLALRPTLLAPRSRAQRPLPLVPLAPPARLSPRPTPLAPRLAPQGTCFEPRTSPPSCRTTTVATPSSRSPPSRRPPRTSSSSSRGVGLQRPNGGERKMLYASYEEEIKTALGRQPERLFPGTRAGRSRHVRDRREVRVKLG